MTSHNKKKMHRFQHGDTAVLPPDGCCQYCKDKRPGGTHQYQRWSRIVVQSIPFVLCRRCYLHTTPSQQGTTALSSGRLSIVKKNGKPLSQDANTDDCKELCVGYKDKKIKFDASNREYVMKRYRQQPPTEKLVALPLHQVLAEELDQFDSTPKKTIKQYKCKQTPSY
jgi:hypothetical protein